MSNPEYKILEQVQPYNQLSTITKTKDDNGNLYYAKIFRRTRVEELGLGETIEYNLQVLSNLQGYAFPKSFLTIEVNLSNASTICFLTQPFDCTLAQYIRTQSKMMSEKELLYIFQQIVKSIFTLHNIGYWHSNIRSEHFVKSDGEWKLGSLVFEFNNIPHDIKSQYLWDTQYQAPECYTYEITDKQSDQLIVWNLGSLLLDMMLTTHRLNNKEVVDKFKDQLFSCQKIGMKKALPYSSELMYYLGLMLHYVPERRMTLAELFSCRLLSGEVANISGKLSLSINRIPLSGKNTLKPIKLAQRSENELLKVSQNMNMIDKENKKMLQSIRINDVIPDYQFYKAVNTVSTRLRNKQTLGTNLGTMVQTDSEHIKKAIQYYKCLYDQSQLLEIGSKKLQTVALKQPQPQQVKLLAFYAISLVSLINLHTISRSLTLNLNLLNLNAEIFTIFMASEESKGLQRIINHQKKQKQGKLQSMRIELQKIQPIGIFRIIPQLLNQDYKTARFSDIKAPYRHALKVFYDYLAEEYLVTRETPQGIFTARLAMYATYCLTIDKLYLKDNIADNFRFYFQWRNKQESDYVPTDGFRQYIETAPKATLIKHSRYIFEKYYLIPVKGK